MILQTAAGRRLDAQRPDGSGGAVAEEPGALADPRSLEGMSGHTRICASGQFTA